MSTEMSTHKEFRDSLFSERDILIRYSETWTKLMESGEVIPELVKDQARSAVGKATLLLGKKLKQFEELIEQAEHKTSVKDISINDLMGYWELMEYQINEVKNLFKNIEKYSKGGGSAKRTATGDEPQMGVPETVQVEENREGEGQVPP